MMTLRASAGCTAVVVTLSIARLATAQRLGTFSWQLQPFCNVLTVSVTQSADVARFDGFDDQCGAATRAAASGVAFPNPDGSIGIGLVIIVTPGGAPLHVDATIDVATLSGTWIDNNGLGGVFAFNSATGGPARPANASLILTTNNINGQFLGRRANGSPAAPSGLLFGQSMAAFGGRGFSGNGFSVGLAAAMRVVATENWSPNATGAALHFFTTPNGTAVAPATPGVVIDHDGQVGIGTTDPQAPLDVQGNLRVGSCVIQTDGDIVCVSDARMKRDVRPLSPALDRLAGLEPVRYFWRAAEFPDRDFEAAESYGLVAQDVEAVLPELVTTDAAGYKAVNYGRVPLLTLQAVKELKARNEALEAQYAALEQRLSALEALSKR